MYQNFFEHNRGKLYYEISGSGIPIVFIHGFSLDHRMWEPQRAFFEKTNTVITYDLRGLGQSSLPTSSYSHVDDLQALLNHLQITKLHIVGLSLGGEIAIDFAIRYPDNISSLSLINSSLGGYTSTVDWNVHAKERGVRQAKENWLHHNVFTSVRKNKDILSFVKTMINDYSGWHWLNQDIQIQSNSVAINNLEKISCKTLIVVGEQDLSYYHDIAGLLKRKIVNAELVTIKNVGHLANLEATREVNGLLRLFIHLR